MAQQRQQQEGAGYTTQFQSGIEAAHDRQYEEDDNNNNNGSSSSMSEKLAKVRAHLPKLVSRYTFCLLAFVIVLIACIILLMYLSLTHDQACGSKCKSYGEPGLYLSAFGNCQALDKSNNTCKSSNNGPYYAAINKYQFGEYRQMERSPVCNKCILISGPKGRIKAKITDVCGDCAYGGIRLNQEAFRLIADSANGNAPVSWSPC
ncbi:hypothetical protein GGI12_002134 [Dipsacomyces acuminosporus]|nr:hypothetical protein GGI12_002134 [Dipsacomyces acuminosporus]